MDAHLEVWIVKRINNPDNGDPGDGVYIIGVYGTAKEALEVLNTERKNEMFRYVTLIPETVEDEYWDQFIDEWGEWADRIELAGPFDVSFPLSVIFYPVVSK